MRPEVRRVPLAEVVAGVDSGGMTRADAISAETAGSTSIFSVVSRIAPGHSSSPHVHTNCESSIYVVSGRGHMLAGAELQDVLPMEPGDFLFVPPGAPHAPVNDGSEELVLVVSRNTAQEVVEDYTPPGAAGAS